MSKQPWTITINPPDARSTIDVRVESGLEPLEHFFFEAPEKFYPLVLSAAATDVGYGFNESGVNFSEDVDEDDEPMGEDEVELYDMFNKVRMAKRDFLVLLHDVSQKLLSTKQERGEAASEWEKGMKDGIAAVAEHIAKL